MIAIFIVFLLLGIFIPRILALIFSEPEPKDAKYLADRAKIVLLLRSFFFLIAFAILIFSTLVIVNAGHVGVITRFGASGSSSPRWCSAGRGMHRVRASRSRCRSIRSSSSSRTIRSA